jgi:hypothetical protein
MSTTAPTTTQVEPTSVRQLLRAYDVLQTGQEEDEIPETLIQHTSARARGSPQSEVEDNSLPSHISDDVNSRRAVPPHRPIGDHTLASRPGGQNRIEGAFATFAFVGVYTMGFKFPLVLHSTIADPIRLSTRFGAIQEAESTIDYLDTKSADTDST